MGLAYQSDQQSNADCLPEKVLVFAITARRSPQSTTAKSFESVKCKKQQDNRMCAITHINLSFSEPGLDFGLYWWELSRLSFVVMKVDLYDVSVATERLCEAGSEIETTFVMKKISRLLKTRDPFTPRDGTLN